MTSWSQRIKSAREDMGISMTQAANHIGIWSGTLSKYESGKNEPCYSVGRDIDRFYGIGCDRCEGIQDGN